MTSSNADDEKRYRIFSLFIVLALPNMLVWNDELEVDVESNKGTKLATNNYCYAVETRTVVNDNPSI